MYLAIDIVILFGKFILIPPKIFDFAAGARPRPTDFVMFLRREGTKPLPYGFFGGTWASRPYNAIFDHILSFLLLRQHRLIEENDMFLLRPPN